MSAKRAECADVNCMLFIHTFISTKVVAVVLNTRMYVQAIIRKKID